MSMVCAVWCESKIFRRYSRFSVIDFIRKHKRIYLWIFNDWGVVLVVNPLRFRQIWIHLKCNGANVMEMPSGEMFGPNDADDISITFDTV